MVKESISACSVLEEYHRRRPNDAPLGKKGFRLRSKNYVYFEGIFYFFLHIPKNVVPPGYSNANLFGAKCRQTESP